MSQIVYVLRVAPLKPEFGQGFVAKVYDCKNKQSIVAPSKFPTYEDARNWVITKGAELLGDTPYRRCSIQQSSRNRNRFYDANLWA